MKTTPKLNPASIGHFLKILFATVFLGFVLFVTGLIIYIKFFTYTYITYECNEEIFELFKENTDDFDNFVNLLKETNVLAELKQRWLKGEETFMQPQGNHLGDPSMQLKNSGFVTKEQLEEIIVFFEKYRPSSVSVRSYIDAPVYSFTFFSNTHCVALKYIDGADEDETELTIKRVLEFYGDGCEILKFNEHWFAIIIKNNGVTSLA